MIYAVFWKNIERTQENAYNVILYRAKDIKQYLAYELHFEIIETVFSYMHWKGQEGKKS